MSDEIKPYWMDKKTLLYYLDISRQAFDKWDVEPTFKSGKSTYFSIADVIESRAKKHQKIAQLGATKSLVNSGEMVALDIEFERCRLVKAQADSQELKNEISRQEVVPVDFAAFALSTVAAEASGILDSLPLNLIRKHPELTRVQQENIGRELAKAMNALSRLSDKIPEMLDDYIRESDS